MKVVSILGCGWLGKALAQTFLTKNHIVRGSARTHENSRTLQTLGIDAYKIDVKNTAIVGDINAFVEGTDILVTAFPPGLRRNPEADYTARITQVLKTISAQPNCKILHLSSIGVFGGAQGDVDENSTPKPESPVGIQLLEVERTILRLGNKATVVRLGGLVGDGRHPAKQLAGKQHIPAPNAPTNLVHQKDVVAYLSTVIEKSFWGAVLHCVSPEHYQREAFYTQECKENKLPLPHFSDEKSDRTKKVHDTKSKVLFDFNYQLAGCRFKDC